MNFSICLIAKNEEKTLPRLLSSLEEFKNRGGEVILVDTGSTDRTREIAQEWGVRVFAEGERFLHAITEVQTKKINRVFVAKGEEMIVAPGDKLFDYSSARNYAASLASNDMVAMPDCDEQYTRLDLDNINNLIKEGYEQLEYNFVFSHDEFGNEAIKFLHCKFYDRRKLRWTGIIHEVLAGSAKRTYLPESVIKLEHWQNPEQNRGGYLKGLALACLMNPENDRNMHYFGRELLWCGRPKSAIKQLEKHAAMNVWEPERSQSLVFIGDAYMSLGKEDKAMESWQRAFSIHAHRREPLIRLAEYYYRRGDFQRTACYAEAATTIPENNFYANNYAHYTFYPHELLYWAYWYLGNRGKSKEHFDKAFGCLPSKIKYLNDSKFYYELPKVSIIIPTIEGREEGLKKVQESISRLDYPEDKLEVIIVHDSPRKGVPKRVHEGLQRATGEYICFGSTDMEFTPQSLKIAVLESVRLNKGLVAFNTGVISEDEGNINEHFILRRDVIDRIGGKIFDTDFYHVGVDNLLWAQCRKIDEAYRSQYATINHFHFSRGYKMDEVHKLGWSNVEKDRKLLQKKLAKLNA